MHPSMQDGCNRSVRGGCRVNVFADSHHSDIRDCDIDLHLVSKTAVLCINLSSAGSKSQPVRYGLKRHSSPACARAPAVSPHEFEAETSSFKRWQPASPGARAILASPPIHGIVKAGGPHFKKIRHATVKNGFYRVPGGTGRMHPGPAYLSKPRRSRVRGRLPRRWPPGASCASPSPDASGCRSDPSAQNTWIFLINR
jgi:hypothetical protein